MYIVLLVGVLRILKRLLLMLGGTTATPWNFSRSVPVPTPPNTTLAVAAPPVIDFRNITVNSTAAWHHKMQVAFTHSKISQTVSLIPYELNCYPHWPQYGVPDSNYYKGSCQICKRDVAHICSLVNNNNVNNETLSDSPSLWISTESLWRSEVLGWANCIRPLRRFYAAEVFYKSTRSKGIDIPIPTHTYAHAHAHAHAHDAYPHTRADNQERCQNAVHDVTFKGQSNSPERQALTKFVGMPGYAIEFNRKMGEQNERMTDLLHHSRFGLVPAGDGWHSYRLMETMAMGVVPIIISDDWSLPFEDILTWSEFSILVPLANTSHLLAIVEGYRDRACTMSDRVFQVYHQYMANATQIVRGISDSIQQYRQLCADDASCVM